MAAIVNAVWDLYAKVERKPVWKLLADMTPAEIVRCIDFRYITDALTPDEALDLLERQQRDEARSRARAAARRDIPPTRRPLDGLAIPTTRSARPAATRWRRLDALQGQGRRGPDRRRTRVALVREEIGPDRTLMIDANQRWDVDEAIDARQRARAIRPALDRGADQPGRCARPCDDCAGGAPDRRRDRRALREPRAVQAAAPGRARSASARSTAAAWAASTRTSRSS